ncbi:MAG: NADH:flavin oxidoreductase/NADH oxidase family protein [Ketobacter sp.]|uniref:NADH:flavin oxidoreductase/NADH oxidase family protein n=1 Tax=Ketobacter sp. MCCC 1A13808 TaxID=2602738 RepID=UPI0026D45802|nr:NADH:flavin oxidoreductase/NADH oxidase family protein [Ketobacter sp. MCCC 1A13808]
MTGIAVLTKPLQLKNGVIIKNRLAKSAMSEALATTDNRATDALVNLYRAWATGGTGLLITGNVMVDRSALGEPNNLAIEDERDLPRLTRWAQAATANNTQAWVQLNHPGKQSPKLVSRQPVAPSAIPLGKQFDAYFHQPKALTQGQIEDIIQRFATAAAICKKAGFSGVQIHGAHGYLVSQFLSPHHNQRQDQWGGSLQNRARFVLEIYSAIRSAVGVDFPISIKMNSADFQRGGFTQEESMQVAEMLAEVGIDLIEISGGTYESPQMTGRDMKASTQKREAYFLEYAERIRSRIDTPLMVTGGFRTAPGMADAIDSGATDLVGLARPLAVDPAFSQKLLRGEAIKYPVKPRITGIKMVDNMAMMETIWYSRQMERIAHGRKTKPNESPIKVFVRQTAVSIFRGFKTQRLRAN